MIEIYLVFWPAFVLGLLHAIFPCEDKAIFGFYAFGVSRDWRNAFTLMNAYGMGLMAGNLLVSLGFIFLFGGLLRGTIHQTILNYLTALSMILAGVVMFFIVSKGRFEQREQARDDESAEEISNIVAGRAKAAFLLGVLSGIPPCFMELTIYFQASLWAAQSGWYSGVVGVFFFGLGTWLGLFPLGLLGVVGSKAKAKRFVNPLTFEQISAALLLGLGIIYLVLAVFDVSLFS